jgi:monoamine oxidase
MDSDSTGCGTDARRSKSRLFGPQATSVTGITMLNWAAEPWTSPPSSAAASASAYQLYGHPAYRVPALDGRLHWASTETAPNFGGHVEGALAAAERAVATILTTVDRATTPTTDHTTDHTTAAREPN